MADQPYRRGTTIHELVADSIGRYPDRTAVLDDDTGLTYRELDALAQDFAAELTAAGVEPESIVPLVMERSTRLVIAALAVLRCGAAYAALDTSWPVEHLNRLIGLMRPPAVVTDRTDLAAGLTRVTPASREGFAATVRAPRPHVPARIHGASPATVYFTSGTTGTPKGVLSPHLGTVRLLQDCPFATFDHDTVMPLAAAVPWDALSCELWGPLMNGGAVVVVADQYLLPGRLRQLIDRHGVQTAFLTTTLFHMFVDEDPGSFAGMRQVLVGGERVSAPHFARFLDRFPDITLVHVYGPAEATTFASILQVRPEDCTLADGVPLGHAVPHTGLYVWDGSRECAPGQVGELLISGDGLAVRYLGDPALTEEKFRLMPVGGRPTRVYRTGDLAHRDEAGRLFYDGRTDRQVKIRGHRIELGSVEAAALAVPGVTWCRALPVEGPDGRYRDLYLAYTSRSETPVDSEQVRETLRESCPAYLVPRRLLRISTLPLTGTGKLDERALIRRMVEAEPAAATPVAGPRDGAVGTVVADVVESVLGHDLDVDLDFFAAGGTSIDLGVVCTRLSARLGDPVPISMAVQRPTIRQLATWLAERRRGSAGDGADSAGPETGADADGQVPLSDMQTSFWMRQARDPQDTSGLCPMVYLVDGPLDRHNLAEAFRDVVDRHPALRAVYTLDPDDDEHAVAIPVETPVDDPVEWLAADPTPEAALDRLAASLMRPLDIEEGPVCRLVVVPVTDGAETLLGIVVHHIAFDGHSEAVLLNDLARAYDARQAGEVPQFSEPTPSLAQSRRLLLERAASADLKAQRRHWQDTLPGTPDLPFPVPGDAAGRRGGQASGERAGSRTHVVRLDAEVGVEVGRVAQKYGTTPFAVLLSAFAAATAVLTGQHDFGLGVTVSRRAGAGIEHVVGCFVDTICLRPRPVLDAGWPGLLDALRPVIRNGLAAQDIPFGEVVRLLNPPRGDRDPLYQSLFVYHDQRRPDGTFGGHRLERVPLPAQQGVGELVVELWPEPAGGFTVDMTYQTGAITGEFIARLGAELVRTLRHGPAPR